jgi:hypothetical protein
MRALVIFALLSLCLITRAASSNENPWNDALRAFDSWAAEQELYPPDQVAQLRQRLLEKATQLPESEAAHFREEMQAKIASLNSPEAQAAERWMAATLAVASDAYRQKLHASLPDVIDDSPGKLRAELDTLAARETNLKQVRQGFDQSRNTAVQATEHEARQQAQANLQMRSAANYGAMNRYRPTQGNQQLYQRYSGYKPYDVGPYGYPFGLGFWW